MVVPGDERSGVVQHLLAVARLTGADVQRSLAPPPAGYDLVHTAFTDALWGPDVSAAAARFTAWAATVREPVVVTLHDVPGADPDPARDARRTAGFAQVAAAADLALVCSAQEAARLRPRPQVVPLPLEPLAAPGPPPAWANRPTVGVLGFVFPGKGHDRVVAAAAGTGARVVAIGGPSPGHEPLVGALHRQAAGLGVDLHVTGHLPEADLHAAARAVTVPVAAYSTTGASGSLVTWIAAGRRPVTTSGPYADELAGRWPGALLLVDDLPTGVRDALREPARTWAEDGPQRPDVGAQHLAVYRRLVA